MKLAIIIIIMLLKKSVSAIGGGGLLFNKNNTFKKSSKLLLDPSRLLFVNDYELHTGHGKHQSVKHKALPTHARVVVSGAGIVGTSVAYHLIERGWIDVVVLDQNRIGCGATSNGSGLVSQVRATSERLVIKDSIQLYKKLEGQGHDIDWDECGSLNIAQTWDGLIMLRRFQDSASAAGLKCELLSRAEITKLHPLLKVDDVEGGLWLPSDGVADTQKVCLTLADLSKQAGAEFIENCKVLEVLTQNDKVNSVVTSKGQIQCDYFVNCSGLWSHELALNTTPPVSIPVQKYAQMFIVTKPIADGNMDSVPFIQDYDAHLYIREYNGGFLAGGFEPETEADSSENASQPDWNKFKPLYEKLVSRVPKLAELEVQHFTTTNDSFSPDARWILGEATDVKSYFVACGTNGNSIVGAGGIGKAVADWIVDGEARSHLLPYDIKRFLNLHSNKKFLKERIKEIANRHYSVIYPLQSELHSARKLRCSPLYTVQESAGAVFGERMGFERSLYFDTTSGENGVKAELSPGTFKKPQWFEFVRDEYLTCRQGVGLIDMSSLTKIELRSAGTEVVDFLQFLCSNDVDVPVGSIVQTGMQNEHGGFENDCVIVRRAENHFFIISPTIQRTRLKDWIIRHAPPDGSVSYTDVTSMYTVLNVVGPKSRELMSELTDTNLNLPPFKYKEANVGYASGIMIMGFTNTGEPGFSLYIPSEYALHVYDRLMQKGVDYGLRNVGYFALRYLRIEKFVPFWGEEMDRNTTPYEVNRGFKVKLEKDYFMGKSALIEQQQKGLHRRLVHFTIDDHELVHDIWPWGKEPIIRNGINVGTVTSTGFGFTVDKLVCMGFVSHHDHVGGKPSTITTDYIMDKNAQFEINIAGKKFPMRPSLHPPIIPVSLDTTNQRYIPKVRQNIIMKK